MLIRKNTAIMAGLSKVCLFGLLLGLSAYGQANSKLPDTVDRIKPSIVAVGTFMSKRSPRANFLGTGFVVGRGDLIVTNAHVIPELLDQEHLEHIAIFYRQGNDEKMLPATEVAVDKEHDLSVLKIIETLPAMKLGNGSGVREGQVYAFTGFPIGMVLGLYPVTHRGMVSAITPNVIPTINAGQIKAKLLRRLESPYKVFQLDATAYPGNSGSPLYDVDNGAVIGVINKVFVQESKESVLTNPSGISYAIPVNYVEKLLKDKKLY